MSNWPAGATATGDFSGLPDAPLADRAFVGTAGWAIPRAVAASFPTEGSILSRYAERFNALEINTTFYRSHRASTYARWRDSVPADFRFAVKVPKVISHAKRLQDSAGDFLTFLRETSELGDRRGPLLLQLPPKFEFDRAVAFDFFRSSRNVFDGDMAIEPRHPSWFLAESDALLAEYAIARVGADPPRADSGATPGGIWGLTYLRLHGSPRVYFSAYAADALDRIAALLQNSSGRRWCIFDNTASGAAAGDALHLQSALGTQHRGRYSQGT